MVLDSAHGLLLQIQKIEPNNTSSVNSNYFDNQGQGVLPFIKNKVGAMPWPIPSICLYLFRTSLH